MYSIKVALFLSLLVSLSKVKRVTKNVTNNLFGFLLAKLN